MHTWFDAQLDQNIVDGIYSEANQIQKDNMYLSSSKAYLKLLCVKLLVVTIVWFKA